MTREEAKEIFLNRGYVTVLGGSVFDGDLWRQACVVISEWLKELESCDDVISRQEALKCFTWTNDKADAWNGIKNLPPTTSKEKIGYWINASNHSVICSNCNTYWDYATKYCPYCGRKMEESE